MKLIAFSDLHGKSLDYVRVGDADICVVAGDIAPLKGFSHWDLQKQERWMMNVFCEFVSRHEKTEFVFIAGNHDFWGSKISTVDYRWPKNAHFLFNSGCRVKGINFWGSPVVPPISGRWAFEASPVTMAKTYSLIPEDTDILITHTPPFIGGSDIDISLQNEKEYQRHFGSAELTEAIERVQPEFLFCGHIHSGSHDCTEIGVTKCFNVSLLDEDYQFAYSPFETDVGRCDPDIW